ncbi:MAG: hypothetical protein PWP23_925 [Candidatus Sumerlaeota bacterium]|nr:hypothetical protein [Candidatus Sumerlaeota bacterium]
MPRLPIRHLLLGIALLLACLPLAAQDAPTTPTMSGPLPRLFRVGYLRPEGEAGFTRGQMEALRSRLLADEVLMAECRAAGFDGFGLYETDGGRDMLRRLNAREFDLAFVPLRVWAEQNPAARYEVILQTRRERDATATRGNMVLQRGAVFLSPRSSFFAQDPLDGEAFAAYLRRTRMAVVTSEGMAEFVAPLTALAERYGVTPQASDFLWMESNAEVVKAVVSGLVEVGVCEQGAIEETLAASGAQERMHRVVVLSRPVATDPVVVRPEFAPLDSALGRELKRALRDFSIETGFGPISLQSATNSDYTDAPALLGRFNELMGREIRRP